MRLVLFLSLLLQAFSLLPGSDASPAKQAAPRVKLDYATYEGTTLGNGVRQFLGMRYAAPPLGENRFRRPRDPPKEKGIVAAKNHGAVCYGVQGLAFGSADDVDLGEDCLYIDVYTPPVESCGSGLPVMVWFQGGAFVQLFNPNYNGTGIVEASGGKAIVVSFNYRIGPYGFLATDELNKEGNLNVGLHDQRFALSWVQKHIKTFGGDPDKVTIFGTSVGAGSVLLQTVAYGGNSPRDDTARWNAGIATAPYLPPVFKVSDLRFEYDNLLAATDCNDLRCLRSLGSEAIQAANIGKPFPGQATVALFPYAPVIDDVLFTNHPSSMLKAGKFSHKGPLIIGSSRSEGTMFVPQANTTADINTFLKQQFPALTQADLDAAHALYSTVPATLPGVKVTQAPLYNKAAQMYGDAGYSCPALEFASGLSKAKVDVYYMRDNIIDPVELAAGYIVPHTWEVQAVWGPEYARNYVALKGADSYGTGGVNEKAVPEVQGFWINFAATGGNPNRRKNTDAPHWDLFSDKQQRLRLQTNATVMEDVSEEERDRCAYWASISARTLI